MQTMSSNKLTSAYAEDINYNWTKQTRKKVRLTGRRGNGGKSWGRV